jgi:hypothetical protein
LVATTASRSPSASRSSISRRWTGVYPARYGAVRPPRVLQAQAGVPLDQLDAAARVEEADRADLALHQAGEQAGRLRQRRRTLAEALVDERRVPHRDFTLGARGAVLVDQQEVEAGQPLGQVARVGDRRAREDEAGLAAVRACQPPQAPQHVRDVGAEHAAIDVSLVDHDPGEVREHVSPGAVVRQHPHVQHVRVGEDEVRALSDRTPLLARRVAVVDRVTQETPTGGRRCAAGRARGLRKASELARLVLGERLGGVEVEGPGGEIGRQRVEHRQVEGKRLAARSAGRDHRMAPARGFERVRLMRPQLADPRARQSLS